jgi:predicted nucleic acid-binding protein
MTVIDASVWLDLVTGRLSPEVLPQPPVLVPGHFDAEVLSGLRGLTRGGHLAPADVRRRVEGLARAALLRVAVRDLLGEAWRSARRCRRPTRCTSPWPGERMWRC